ESCPVPIIVAGGKKIPERDALQLTYNAVKAGAVGVDMGRNIWQSEHPVAMIRATRAIIHQNANVDQAFKLYKKLSNEESGKKQKSKGQKPNQNKSKGQKPNQNKSKGKKPNQNKSNKPQNNSQPKKN
ncbi:chromodomain-helicase-DNA-binding protein 4, partial [Marine Group I thaumarchaeote SCGC AAA799-B03]